MHYFFRKQTSFLGRKKKNLFMNFVVQKILFPQEMLRVRWKQEENLRNCFRKDVSSFSRTLQIPTSTRSRLTTTSVWSRLVLSVPRRTVCRTAQIFWCSWSNSFCLLIARLLSSIDAESFFLNCAQRSSSCVTCSFISWNSFWDAALSLSSTLLFKDSSLSCESSRSCKSSYTRWIEISVRKLCRLTGLDKIDLNWWSGREA